MMEYPIGTFKISENRARELNNKKIGEHLRAIVNYQCIEKTKSYTILKIKHISVIQTKRMF